MKVRGSARKQVRSEISAHCSFRPSRLSSQSHAEGAVGGAHARALIGRSKGGQSVGGRNALAVEMALEKK